MIRRATEADLPRLAEIYDAARAYMRAEGNDQQWVNGYPSPAQLRADMAGGWLYAMTSDDGRIYGAFALVDADEPSYRVIEGAWASDAPYAAIHRIASDGSARGVMRQAVAFARRTYDHLRVDTHALNRTMQRAILREGFAYRGVIHLEDGAPRLAYDWVGPGEAPAGNRVPR